MVVVGRLDSSTGLLDFARMTAPDVVIVGLDQPDLPPDCLALFAENGALTVLGLQSQDGLANLYQLRPRRFELGDLAPQDLVSEIRRAARPPFLPAWRAIPRSQP